MYYFHNQSPVKDSIFIAGQKIKIFCAVGTIYLLSTIVSCRAPTGLKFLWEALYYKYPVPKWDSLLNPFIDNAANR